MSNPVIIEALLLVAALSLEVSRVILDELRELDAEEMDADPGDPAVRDRLPRGRGSLAVQRFAGLIWLYVMVNLGFGFPDLDAPLLSVDREPNPHRARLRMEVEFGEFGPALA